MISLLIFTGKKEIMGAFVNRRLTQVVAVVGTLVVLTLNVLLILETFDVSIPGLSSGG
jgi:manganese transport protein